MVLCEARTRDARLGEFDVILMRKDPPFDTEYIYTTYILDRAGTQGALVCNRPQGLRDMKREGLHGLVSRVLRAHPHHPRHARHERISCGNTAKPCASPCMVWEGRSIFVLEQGDKNRNVVFETLTEYGQPVRHRAALPAGDHDLPATAGSFWWTGSRLPFAPGADNPRLTTNRGNLARGPHGPRAAPLNERDRWLCAQIRSQTESSRHDLRRTGCHRRLCHGDQCHQPDGHPRN